MIVKTVIALLSLIASAPLALNATYGINFPTDATVGGSRHLNSVSLVSPADGRQELPSSQAADLLLFHDSTSAAFCAAAGETVSVEFNWTGDWMHGYVYIDVDGDGEFNAASGSDRDVMAFSNFDGFNSAGTATNNGNVGVNPPSFTVPDVEPGLYHIRFKIDWNSIDPGGNPGDANGGNTITANGGAITDALIYIHRPTSDPIVTTEGNGTLTVEPAAGGYKITPSPADGYALDAIRLTGGFELPQSGIEFVNPALARSESTVPAFALRGGALTVSAARLSGQGKVHGVFLACDSPTEGNYEFTGSGNNAISRVTVGTESRQVSASTPHRHFISDRTIAVEPGQKLKVSADYSGSAPLRFFLDHGQDGVFATLGGISSDLLATLAPGAEAEVTINPLLAPGVYRARFEAEGHCCVELLLNVHNPQGSLDVKVMNGNIVGSDGAALPVAVDFGSTLAIKPMTVMPGFGTTELIVRHGQNLNGPALVKGNRQWTDTTLKLGSQTLPAELIDGDVELYAIYAEKETSEWTKVWGDEFNGSELDLSRWKYQPRYSATWNRLVAQGDEIPLVNVVADGHYKSYCIPAPAGFDETQPMISGAINSHGLFHFTHGRIEARIRTTRHTGNFPAFWMMPMDQSKGWPKDGEIDIWEQIDDAQRSYHTIHSGWTYKSFGDVAQSSPQSSGNVWADHDLWHVYALEWDAESLKWYVDGQLAFTYTNSHYSDGGSYTEEVTWPFNKDFYVILNQSVGNGAWAKPCDTTFTYLTEFDWVRVYKKKTDNAWTSKIDHNGDDPDFYVAGPADDPSSITSIDNDETDSAIEYFDLRGVKVTAPSAPGLYLERRGNRVTKTLRH